MNKKVLSLILFISVFATLTLTSCSILKFPGNEVTTTTTTGSIVETTSDIETTNIIETTSKDVPDKVIVVDGTKTTEKAEEEPLVIDKKTEKTTIVTTKKTTTEKTVTTKKTTTTKKETTIKTTKATKKTSNKKETSSFTYATAGEGNTAYSDAEGYWSPRY